METYYWIFLLLFLWFVVWRTHQTLAVRNARKKQKTRGDRESMKELARQFIGKDCMIYTVSSPGGATVSGILREISDSGLLVEETGSKQLEAINLDYVVRLREYPTNKKGKKKSVVLD